MRENPVFKILSKILFGPIIIYGLYVQFHGDYGPGGGFQAGVIVAAAFILYSIIFGLERVRKLMPVIFVNYIIIFISFNWYFIINISHTLFQFR